MLGAMLDTADYWVATLGALQASGVPWDIVWVFALLLIAVILFVTEKFPVDVVAVTILAALFLLDLVGPEEGLSGFASTATVTVGAMFVLSAGLQRTGAVGAIGLAMRKIGQGQSVFLLAVMVVIGVISAFVNNTAAVAVFLPLVIASCVRRKISPSKVLIPLSYASQFGGVCTLIGTSTNLLVSAIAVKAGYDAFSVFEFGKLGIIMMVVGVVYFLVIGRWLLPQRRSSELTEAYELRDYITEFRILDGSPLIGKRVHESGLRDQHDATVLKIIRKDATIDMPVHHKLREGDILLVEGRIKELMDARETMKLAIEPRFKLSDKELKEDDMTLVEVLIAPRSKLINATLKSLDFRRRFKAIVLAVQRKEQTLRKKLNSVRLKFGDALLIQAHAKDVAQLRTDSDFVVLDEVDAPSLRKGKAPVALTIVAVAVALAALGVFPILHTAIAGCAAMILTRCINMEQAYAAVDWKVIFLLAGILPLGLAMESTGAAQLIADNTLGLVSDMGPLMVLAVLYLLTATLTETMSNNASAVLLAPIAISISKDMNVDPKPFLMAVCFAASTSFATPVGYQTNTMVYNPGGYKFTDFMKVGIPLNLIFWALAVFFIPIFWPFHPCEVAGTASP
jgi:di/tricarboxylate transporter